MAVDAVVPIFRAAVEAAEGALLRMHEQGFGGDAPPAVAAPSPYMAELARQLSHFRCGPAPRAANAAPPAAHLRARARQPGERLVTSTRKLRHAPPQP